MYTHKVVIWSMTENYVNDFMFHAGTFITHTYIRGVSRMLGTGSLSMVLPSRDGVAIDPQYIQQQVMMRTVTSSSRISKITYLRLLSSAKII